MDWQEIKAKYEAGHSPTAQAVEDMVARRVLNGLGLVERELPSTEIEVFGEITRDAPLWDRVLALLKVGLQRQRIRGLRFETLGVTGKHLDILERFRGAYDEDSETWWRTVYLARVGKTKRTLAYFLADTNQETHPTISIGTLAPPFTALAAMAQYYVVTQDIETLLKSFGPYNWKANDG